MALEHDVSIGYSDRQRKKAGGWVPLASLNLLTLSLQFERDCPASLRSKITAEASEIRARRDREREWPISRTVEAGIRCSFRTACNRAVQNSAEGTQLSGDAYEKRAAIREKLVQCRARICEAIKLAHWALFHATIYFRIPFPEDWVMTLLNDMVQEELHWHSGKHIALELLEILCPKTDRRIWNESYRSYSGAVRHYREQFDLAATEAIERAIAQFRSDATLQPPHHFKSPDSRTVTLDSSSLKLSDVESKVEKRLLNVPKVVRYFYPLLRKLIAEGRAFYERQDHRKLNEIYEQLEALGCERKIALPHIEGIKRKHQQPWESAINLIRSYLHGRSVNTLSRYRYKHAKFDNTDQTVRPIRTSGASLRGVQGNFQFP